MGLSKEMTDTFTYIDMLEELAACMVVCQKRDHQVWQKWAEMAEQDKGT